MSQANFDVERAEALRQKTIGIVENLLGKAGMWELPKPPESLTQSRQKLADNTYRVLVVGEAKRGKSSFINALIGRSLLPTDVDIATCQVFQVRHSETERYRLRFEDNSEQGITAADLPKYGSQVVQDDQGTPSLDQIIRYIEVDVPLHFLPQGVSILDTPGLGALYAAHAQITQRFVPQADAVIFVLDSNQPISQPEMEFLEQILTVTRNVFFIQTKIDLHSRDKWQTIQQRNGEILRQKFGSKLPDARVWPISSAHLQKAGETGDETYLLTSRQPAMAAALQGFLARVAGWSRAADALATADAYRSEVRQVLAGRLSALAEESKQKRASIQEQAQKKKAAFDQEWGESGGKRRGVQVAVQKLGGLGKQQIRQALQPGGSIDIKMRAQIDEIKNVEGARAMGKSLSGDVVAAASAQWAQVCKQAQDRAAEELRPFMAEVASLTVSTSGLSGPVNIHEVDPLRNVEDNWWTRIKGMRNEGMAAFAIGNIATWLFPPAAPLAVAGLLFAVVKGWKDSGERETERAKSALNQHLAQVLRQVQTYFFDVDLASGRSSLVDEYFESLQKAVNEQMQTVVRQKAQEAKREIDRLSETAKLDEEQRKAKAQEAQGRIQEWDALGTAIKTSVDELKSLELDASTMAPAGV